MSLIVLLNHKLYNYVSTETLETNDNLEMNRFINRAIQDIFTTVDGLYEHIATTTLVELEDFLNTTDQIDRSVISRRLVSDIFNTRDYITDYRELNRSVVDNFTFQDFVQEVLKPAFLPEPFDLEQRVQFTYNGALCEGTIVEIHTDPIYQIAVEVDVCSNYSVLPEEDPRVLLDISKYEIHKIYNPQNYY